MMKAGISWLPLICADVLKCRVLSQISSQGPDFWHCHCFLHPSPDVVWPLPLTLNKPKVAEVAEGLQRPWPGQDGSGWRTEAGSLLSPHPRFSNSIRSVVKWVKQESEILAASIYCSHNPHNNLINTVLSFSILYRWGNWGLERSSDLLRAQEYRSWGANSRARTVLSCLAMDKSKIRLN